LPDKRRLHAAPATLLSLALTLALAVVGVMVLSGGRAQASHVSCGDKITTDTRLDSDLVNCPNNGIVIGADGVTLNLNGHLIDGDGTPFAACPRRKICDVGLVDDGHDGVTVRDGSVREFDAGVLVGSARRSRVLGVSSSRNEIGVVIVDAARSLVRNSSANRSIEQGLVLFHSDHNRILHSSFRHNGNLGVIMRMGSTANLIEGNLFSGKSHAPQIVMEDSNANRVSRNRCVRINGCIVVDAGGNRNVIARNRVARARANGIAIEDGDGNVVAHNVVVHPGGAGIRLGLAHPRVGGADNVVRRNLVRGGGSDAYLVSKTDNGSLLSRNVAVGAGDDGFDVRSRTAKLADNRAVRNRDLGIEAVRGVIDGSGNIARGNGDPRQCVNIACS
jgi:Periplasmic copper-binding protein (NosD)